MLAISIHQNSYTNNSVKGPQVFFYTESDKSRELATYIQNVLNEGREDNKRDIKANKDYYILKKSEIPLAIVECGFLSNEEEAELLNSEEYQCKMADDITKGVIMWINDSL
jgi:N-acetylmuramoyl-L-alanine amidase